MVLTDTHTHLYYETDVEKRKALLDRCKQNNVDRLFLPNVDEASVSAIVEMVDAYPDRCFPMMGLHPCEVKPGWEKVLDSILEQFSNKKIYAIGEIGIDLYCDKSFLDGQIAAFTKQIALAKQFQLPIVIHCRDSFNEVYNVLQQEADDNLRGIFHCFTGSVEQANKITEMGFYLGIGGVVTYKNSGLDKTLAEVDMKHLVLETDSPYLTPVPHRGKRNESSYLLLIAQKVADIYGVDVETVAEVTTRNSQIVFGI